MTLSPDQISLCKNIMNKLESKTISRMFAVPVDPIKDECPNYNEIVTHPMDLSTVKSKLDNGEYKLMSEWKKDVELIWSNSLSYNKTNVLMKIITTEMQEYFQQLSRFITDDPVADWSNKLVHLREQLKYATKPYEPGFNLSQYKQKMQNMSVNNLMPSTKGPKNKFPLQSKKKGPNANGQGRKSIFSKTQMMKLTNQLSQLNDEQKVVILETIEEEEPTAVPVDGSSLNLDPHSLKNTTLQAIKSKLDTMSAQKE